MQTKRTREEHDQGMPRVWRAAIYLCNPATSEGDRPRNVPSITQQRVLCHGAASALHAEVVGEFVDAGRFPASRPGLHKVMERVGESPRPDYLIVSSRDRLACDRDEAFEVAWRLGLADTVVISAIDEFLYPWTSEPLPSRT